MKVKKRIVIALTLVFAMALSVAALFGCGNDTLYKLSFDYNGGAGNIAQVEIKKDLVIPELPVPTDLPQGKTFKGWLGEDGKTLKKGDGYSYGKDTVAKADYELTVYKITYDQNGGNDIPEDAVRSYTISASEIVLPVIEKTGYVFKGWKTADGRIIKVIAINTVGDLALTADWDTVKYTVTFDYNGGSGAEQTREVAFGDTLDLPTPSSLPLGMKFVCWKDENGKVVYSGTAVNFRENVRFIAEYSAVTYKVTYNENGGSNVPASAVKTYTVSDSDINLPVIERTGYTFNGWLNAYGETITVIAKNTAGDLALTADWTANSYKIIFDYGNGDVTEGKFTYGEKITELPTPSTLPAGKKFDCWKCGDDIISVGTVMKYTNAVTLKAYYGIFDYKITYDVDGGDPLSGAITSYSISETAIPLPTPTKIGYNFIGWKNDDATITAIPANTTGNLDLVAVWQVKTYTVTFDSNGGNGTPDSQEIEYGKDLVLPSAAKTGYEFIGWKFNGKTIKAGSVLTYEYDENITFTAEYELAYYDIVYILNGGDAINGEKVEKYSISDSEIGLPTASRTGYEFIGWKINDSSNIVTKIPPQTAEELTLTAEWQAIEYTVTFDYNGGSGNLAELKVYYDEIITLPENVTAPQGYALKNWKYGDTVISKDTVMKYNENITLTAEYEKITYNITYVLGGGTIVGTEVKTYVISGTETALPTASRSGYDFKGWSLNGETVSAIPANTTGDLNLTAVWEQSTEITITFDNTSNSSLTSWTDETTGVKQIKIEYGEKVTIPQIKYDVASTAEKNNDDYTFQGWYYINDNGDKVQFDATKALTKENFADVADLNLTLYVKVNKQWAGPY